MKEFKNIVAAYKKIDFSTKKAALATVVKVRGSSYRSPGARMLITNDGHWVGSISGGCLEGDALRKARQVMSSGAPRLVTYDTTEDGNLGIGLGCNGIIDVLIQPIDEHQASNPVSRLEHFIAYEDLTVMATIFKSDKEACVADQLWLDQAGMLRGDITNESLKEQIHHTLLQVRSNLKPTIKSYGEGATEVFFEVIEPTIDLLIYGGGFDARPVVDIAKMLGWDVTVLDECIAHLSPVNFPSADSVMLCRRDSVNAGVAVKPFSAAVLMSHSYDYDIQVLRKLLDTNIAYIGILGPRKRTEKMFSELEKQGVALSSDQKNRIHSPVGLDIGAETPEEIALSIISEIQTKFSNRSGGFLKYRSAPIHHRDGKDEQVFRQVFIHYRDQKAGSA